jgi:hypothetical protein
LELENDALQVNKFVDLQGPKQPDRLQICKKVPSQMVIKP